MSDTPRTDTEAFAADDSCYDVVQADFARDLERENAALREAARRGVEVMADEDYLSASEQFERANEWRKQSEQMRERAERAERAEAELAAADVKLKNYEEQAQSFHEEYRRKCDVETKNLEERLVDTQHRNGANIVRLERAESALAAIKAAQPDGWQPIETAPKDGTVIDLWAGHYRYTACRWSAHFRAWIPEGSAGHGTEHVERPTHWMPLPNAPKEAR